MTSASERLAALVQQAIGIMADVEKKEEELAAAKKLLERVQRTDLPELLKELGLSDASLKELGVKVSLTQGIDISIPEAGRADAFAWLAEKGYGSIVKADVKVSFGAAELEKAQECAAVLTAKDFAPIVAMNVHAQTLKSWAKERMQAGDDIPPNLFSVHPYDMAKITPMKARK